MLEPTFFDQVPELDRGEERTISDEADWENLLEFVSREIRELVPRFDWRVEL